MGRDTYSRKNLRVLTSVDYAKMSDEDKAKESEPASRWRLRAELDPPRGQGPRLLRGARPQREDLRDHADPRARARRHAVRPRRPAGRRQPEPEVTLMLTCESRKGDRADGSTRPAQPSGAAATVSCWRHWTAGPRASPSSPRHCRPADRSDGYAIQAAVAGTLRSARRRLEDRGDEPRRPGAHRRRRPARRLAARGPRRDR